VRVEVHPGHLLELMASAPPPQRILEELTLRLESLMPDSCCSILLLEGDRLRHGAAPSLPGSYCCAIDGLVIGPKVGSCGTAAHLNELVVARDTQADERWADFRELADRYGLRSCWSSPISAPDGAVLGTFAVYHGVPHEPGDTELRLLESFSGLAAIAIRHARAVDASRATRDLLSAISHELRTPMSSIVGFSEILRRDDLPEERRAGAVEHITDAARHILGLVEDLLDLAKLDAGVAALQLKAVELGPLLGEVSAMLSPLAEERGVEVSVSGCGAVWADERRLRQALLNLVGNAIKFSPAGARVSIAAEGDRIVVRDQGPGIADAERAFAPFERLGAEQPGTGLGLTLSRQFVEAMGGTLALEQDSGTIATICLDAPV
jgi:two-component system cell cycle sensor histidine kinase PleC